MKKKKNSTRVHKIVLVILCSLGPIPFTYGQSQDEAINITAGSYFFTNITGFDDELPFWLHANRDGVVDQSSANLFGYLSGFGSYDLNENLTFKAGTDIYTHYTDLSAFVNKLYTKLEGYNYVFAAGKFTDPLTKKENALSTGSFMYSNNAQPIPKIAIYTDGFLNVPGTQGIVRYKGLFGHGWFEEDRYTSNAYLHEKYFYLSFKYAFFEVVGGVVHNAQWAGVSQSGQEKIPSSWNTFKEVVFARSSSDPDARESEQTNSVGNSVAAYDFSIGFFSEKLDLRVYKLFYLEDKVSTQFRSPWDGVLGLSIKPKDTSLIQNILWEHINTKRQDSFDYEPYGTANYYSHGLYRSGWTYQRRVIGNPLILTDGSDGSSGRPIYNNIIIAHHGGISGKFIDQLNYKLLYTFSRNYGTVTDQIIQPLPLSECNARPQTVCAELRSLEELKKINHSFYIEVGRNTSWQPRLKYNAGLAFDYGELYPGNHFGIMMGLKYELY